MSFDEQPDAHCACCRAWEERWESRNPAPAPKVDMGPCEKCGKTPEYRKRIGQPPCPPDPSSAAKEGVEALCTALRADPGYWTAWEANIAMAFKDEVARNPKASVHEQANEAARNFLTMLTRLAALGQEKPCPGPDCKHLHDKGTDPDDEAAPVEEKP